jgi:transposase
MSRPEAPFRDARRAHIRELRESWQRNAGKQESLRTAHRLLDDEAIDEGIVRSLWSLCRPRGASRYEFPPTEDRNYVFLSEKDLVEYLRPAVLHDLQSGRLIADGLAPSDVAAGKRKVFAADRWQVMGPDWDNDRAICAGQVAAVGIAVMLPADALTRPVALPKASAAGLERWFRKVHVPSHPQGCPRKQSEGEASAAFPGGYDRDQLRALRTQQPGWSRRGRRAK